MQPVRAALFFYGVSTTIPATVPTNMIQHEKIIFTLLHPGGTFNNCFYQLLKPVATYGVLPASKKIRP